MVVYKPGGNIFDSECEWLVCPTNLEGPMGAGLAKVFRDHYPGLERDYRLSCIMGTVSLERYFYWIGEQRNVLCIPTKDRWAEPSTIELVNLGCLGISQFLKDRLVHNPGSVKSIALPALGCGLGGLSWKEVSPVLLDHARSWARVVDYIEIYSPR